MGLPSMNPILKAAASTSQAIDTNSQAIVGLRNQQADMLQADAALQQDTGLNNVLIESVKNQATLNEQLARAKIGAAYGADVTQQGEQITKNAAIGQAAYEERMRVLQDIKSKDSVGFMDNPLGYIINQFTINDDITKHNSALEIEQAAYKHNEQITADSGAAAINQKNFTVSTSQAAIDANAKNILNTATIAANASKIAALNHGVEAYQTTMLASREKTDLQFKLLGAEQSQAKLQLEMASFALHKESAEAAKEARNLEKLGDAAVLPMIQAGLKLRMGDQAPDLSNPTIAAQYLQLQKRGGIIGKDIDNLILEGRAGVLGGTPAQMLEMLESNKGIQFTPAQEPFRKLFEQARKAVDTLGAAGTLKKDMVKGSVDKFFKEEIEKMAENIKPEDKDNVLNIQSVASILKDAPSLASSPFAQKVLIPGLKTGATYVRAADTYSAMIAAVEAGTISQKDAVDGYVELFQKGVMGARDIKNPMRLGISNYPNSYNSEIEVNPYKVWGKTDIIDNTSRAAVDRAVNKTRAAKFINRAAEIGLTMRAE
jgi:hypothetical protein